MVIGALDVDGNNTGNAYLLSSNGQGILRIDNPSPQARDFFGSGLSSAGDTMIVGAYQVSPSATGGTAYLFDDNGNLISQFNNPNPNTLDLFGYSVTTNGSEYVVGAVLDDTFGEAVGAAYVFNAAGELLQTLHPPAPGPRAQFGRVASNGNQLLVSAHFDGGSAGSPGPGRVYVYSTVPEPSALILATLASAALCWRFRRFDTARRAG